MYQGCKKYIPFTPVSLPDRTWPNNRIEKAPTWCPSISATAIRRSSRR